MAKNSCQKNFRNKSCSILMPHKIDKNKKVAPKLIFFNEIFFRKIQTIFDVEKRLWKSEICNFVTLSPLSKKVLKNCQCNFCDSTSDCDKFSSNIVDLMKCLHKVTRRHNRNLVWRQCWRKLYFRPYPFKSKFTQPSAKKHIATANRTWLFI